MPRPTPPKPHPPSGSAGGMTYQDIGYWALGPMGQVLVCLVTSLTTFLAGCICFMVLTNSIITVARLSDASSYALAAGLVFPTVLMDTFSQLAWLSTLGTLSSASITVSVVYFAARGPRPDPPTELMGGNMAPGVAVFVMALSGPPPPPPPRDASEGKGPRRRPQKRLGRRLEEVLGAVTVGYKSRGGWHLPPVGQWLGIGRAPCRGGGGVPRPLPMPPPPPV